MDREEMGTYYPCRQLLSSDESYPDVKSPCRRNSITMRKTGGGTPSRARFGRDL